ncbi:MAG: hypothetical protein R3282_07635 [Rhodothermales bacterium]|nr:hypothetical protein [Rhodothermales bacterium]
MKTQNRARLACFLLPLLLLILGCDSYGDDDPQPTDEEMLVGKWAITGFVDDTGDRSDIIAKGYAGVHLEFVDDGSGGLEVFPKHGPAKLIGTSYHVDDELNFISMIVDFGLDAVLSLDMAYTFSSDGQKASFHTIHSDALNTIFQSDLTGDVRVIASKFGEEGVPE